MTALISPFLFKEDSRALRAYKHNGLWYLATLIRFRIVFFRLTLTASDSEARVESLSSELRVRCGCHANRESHPLRLSKSPIVRREKTLTVLRP